MITIPKNHTNKVNEIFNRVKSVSWRDESNYYQHQESTVENAKAALYRFRFCKLTVDEKNSRAIVHVTMNEWYDMELEA